MNYKFIFLAEPLLAAPVEDVLDLADLVAFGVLYIEVDVPAGLAAPGHAKVATTVAALADLAVYLEPELVTAVEEVQVDEGPALGVPRHGDVSDLLIVFGNCKFWSFEDGKKKREAEGEFSTVNYLVGVAPSELESKGPVVLHEYADETIGCFIDGSEWDVGGGGIEKLVLIFLFAETRNQTLYISRL